MLFLQQPAVNTATINSSDWSDRWLNNNQSFSHILEGQGIQPREELQQVPKCDYWLYF